jgi:hypothetical protein
MPALMTPKKAETVSIIAVVLAPRCNEAQDTLHSQNNSAVARRLPAM